MIFGNYEEVLSLLSLPTWKLKSKLLRLLSDDTGCKFGDRKCCRNKIPGSAAFKQPKFK